LALGERASQIKYLDEQRLATEVIFQNIACQRTSTSVDILQKFRKDLEKFINKAMNALPEALRLVNGYGPWRRWILNGDL